MRQINRLAAAAGILAVVTAAYADTITTQKSYDLSRAGDTTYFQNYKTQVLGIGTDNEGLTMAQLLFPVNKSSLGRTSTTVSEDWSAYNILEVKLTNHEAFPVQFKALVYLTSNPSNSTGCFSGTLNLNPGETRRFCCYLNPDDAMPYGMEYLRPVLSAPFNNVYSSGAFRNLKTIYTWRFSYQGTAPAHVDVSDLRLIKQNLTFSGMVDQFGQYTDRTWPTKINTVNDLATQAANEAADLAANPGPGEQQGSTKVQLSSTTSGQWAVSSSANGNKYLQHPDGNALWVLGVSAVNTSQPTPTGGRENYFQSLPDTSDATFSTCYSTRATLDGNNTCYSFGMQNIMLKYGVNYLPAWSGVVKQRLASWGLNTLGMQCDSNFYDNSIPFTVILSTGSFPTRLKVPHQLWGTLPDPYAATFASWSATTFAKTIAPYNGETNFMGVYVDNEMSWGNTSTQKLQFNIELGVLKAPATQPAKIAFVNFMSGRYKGSINALNSAWGTSYSSFNSMLSTGTYQPSTFTTAQAADFTAFSKAFATQYFSSVKTALQMDQFTGLYLGCRYADYTPEVVSAGNGYVDVNTLNCYRPVSGMDWAFWGSQSKPYMFSELGYSVDADGTFGGVGEVYSQADRAGNLSAILSQANSQPNCVGAVLYCYTDQPITGRYSDYENSGLGLVDITDTPHYEAVNALRNFAKTMYTNRN